MSTTTADEEDIDAFGLVASIVAGVTAAVALFAMTHSLLGAIVGYVFVACLTFVIRWVIHSAE